MTLNRAYERLHLSVNGITWSCFWQSHFFSHFFSLSLSLSLLFCFFLTQFIHPFFLHTTAQIDVHSSKNFFFSPTLIHLFVNASQAMSIKTKIRNDGIPKRERERERNIYKNRYWAQIKRHWKQKQNRSERKRKVKKVKYSLNCLLFAFYHSLYFDLVYKFVFLKKSNGLFFCLSELIDSIDLKFLENR